MLPFVPLELVLSLQEPEHPRPSLDTHPEAFPPEYKPAVTLNLECFISWVPGDSSPPGQDSSPCFTLHSSSQATFSTISVSLGMVHRGRSRVGLVAGDIPCEVALTSIRFWQSPERTGGAAPGYFLEVLV